METATKDPERITRRSEMRRESSIQMAREGIRNATTEETQEMQAWTAAPYGKTDNKDESKE